MKSLTLTLTRSMNRSRTLLLAFGAVHVSAMCLTPQEPVVVSGEVTCADCAIILDTVVTIGGLSGPGLHVIDRFSSVAADRRSRFLISSGLGAEISVFDSTGKFLRTVGRRGEGPGEYESIRHIAVGPRYIHVFDHGRTMLDHDFAVVRTDRFPGAIDYSVVRSDDEVVFAADVPTPESVGHQLHVLRPSGELVSYGYDGAVYPSPLATRSTWVSPMAGNDDTVWIFPNFTNRLVRWDLGQEPMVGRVFERRVAEFDADTSSNEAAMLDDRGLWIMWHTWDPEWTRTAHLGDPMPSEPPRRWLDGWLDLVDPATGRTIARHHQDGVFRCFAAGYVVAYHETDAGVPFLHILKLRLSRGSAAKSRRPG